MNTKTFILIIALKLLAIQTIGYGIICEIRANASLATILITIGSLMFAIASNTTLFIVTKNSRLRRRESDSDGQ
jgi:hypothetical protein